MHIRTSMNTDRDTYSSEKVTAIRERKGKRERKKERGREIKRERGRERERERESTFERNRKGPRPS